jgi:hypothetical protein
MARSNGAPFYFSLREIAHCLTERCSDNRYVAHVVRNGDLSNRSGIQACVTSEGPEHIARTDLLFTARINLYGGHGAS